MTTRIGCKVSLAKVPKGELGSRVPPERMTGALDTGYRLTSTDLTFYFWTPTDSGLVASSSLEAAPKRAWSDTQKNAVRRALEEWAKISAFSFTEVDNRDEAFIKAVLLDDPSYAYLGEARFPTTTGEGEFYVSYNNAADKDFPVGSYDYITILHELGHVLGLAHPHDNGGTSSIFPGVDSPWDMGTNNQNQTAFTVMSYMDVGGSITPDRAQSSGFVDGPMPYDIATIQAMYPLETPVVMNEGDTTYTIPQRGEGASFVAITDTNGTDTISAAGSSRGVKIDLRPAQLDGSAVGGGGVSQIRASDAGGFVIAAGTTIEHATGGSGADVLIGNDADNVLDGGRGRDVLRGGAGNDRLIGGGGADRLYGDGGDDVLVGTHATHAYGGAGNDTMIARGRGWKLFHGGPGRDTLFLPGRRGNYRIFRRGRRVIFVPRGRVRRYVGNVTTVAVEHVKFYREASRRPINRRLFRR